MHHLTCTVRELNARLAEDVRVTLRSASVQKTFFYSVRWSHEELWIQYSNPFQKQPNPTARRMRLGLRASSSRHAKLKPFTVTVCVCVHEGARPSVSVMSAGVFVCTRARRCTFLQFTMTHWQARIRSESRDVANDALQCLLNVRLIHSFGLFTVAVFRLERTGVFERNEYFELTNHYSFVRLSLFFGHFVIVTLFILALLHSGLPCSGVSFGTNRCFFTEWVKHLF